MKNENILDAIGMINEEAVWDAKEYQRPKSRSWIKWGAMAACLCLVVSFAIPFVFDRGQSSDPLPGGVTAEVIEIIDSNTWKITVTGADDFYSDGEIVLVTLENASDATDDFFLCVGDEIAITYTNYDIIEYKDGSSEILVAEIEIINKEE